MRDRALQRLGAPAGKVARKADARASLADPSDRMPEPGDAKVRAELLQKVRALGGR